MDQPLEQSWIEISRSALLNNLNCFRNQLEGGQSLLPILKSNAYGHGLTEIAELLTNAGENFFALHSAAEIFRLARSNKLRCARFLLLSWADPVLVPELLELGTSFGLFDFEGLAELEAAGAGCHREVPIHLKVETGVQRQGFRLEDLPELAQRLKRSSHIRLEGLYTHYANIEDTTDHTYARAQMVRLAEAEEILAGHGLEPELCHASCSAAAILFPETWHDLVRLGISLYGHWPSRETRVSAQATGRNKLDLEPVLTWKSRIIQVKEVAAGSLVGYGCTWKAETDTRLGVIPVGYADGYDRGLGSAHVLVRGSRAPIRGRVMMNLILIDLGHIPKATRGDEVVLIGGQGDEVVSAELLAELTGTINYEILSRINPALNRVVVE